MKKILSSVLIASMVSTVSMPLVSFADGNSTISNITKGVQPGFNTTIPESANSGEETKSNTTTTKKPLSKRQQSRLDAAKKKSDALKTSVWEAYGNYTVVLGNHKDAENNVTALEGKFNAANKKLNDDQAANEKAVEDAEKALNEAEETLKREDKNLKQKTDKFRAKAKEYVKTLKTEIELGENTEKPKAELRKLEKAVEPLPPTFRKNVLNYLKAHKNSAIIGGAVATSTAMLGIVVYIVNVISDSFKEPKK